MKKAHLIGMLCCSLLVALILPGMAAADEEFAIVKNFGDSLVFFPEVEAKQVILTVTGPCNFEFRQVVTQGELIFKITEETIDGVYRYQLVVIPEVDPTVISVLKQARKTGDNSEVNSLCRDGRLPGDPLTQAAGFRVANGAIVFDREIVEKSNLEGSAVDADPFDWTASLPSSNSPALETPAKSSHDPAAKDFVINDDLIVDGSACIGFDCVNGEVFSFDTIRLKENNLRIKFDDTSVAASFPRNDWQLTANDSANGGASKFSIEDISGGRTPFTVEANARSHSLYVDDGGRIGSRTSTPSTEIHTIDGDTPTLRLQQDGSSGFEPQTWDVAGNETNFFIRDVTNGSALPFRIRPGAPTSSIFIDTDGDVGAGTSSPDATVHVIGTLRIADTDDGTSDPEPMSVVSSSDNGGQIVMDDGQLWRFGGGSGNSFVISADMSGGTEFLLNSAGNLTLRGTLVTGGGGTCDPGPCDGVFKDYELESIEDHAAYMWENHHLWGVGPTPEGAPIDLPKKTTGILHELEKAHIYIEQLNDDLKNKNSQIEDLNTRLARLEALLEAQAAD